jgi:hypothetical protein
VTLHKKLPDPQFDLFVPYVTDLPFRDTQENMERPFFSLAKRKRLKPIEYTSPDNLIYVKVYATPEFAYNPQRSGPTSGRRGGRRNGSLAGLKAGPTSWTTRRAKASA